MTRRDNLQLHFSGAVGVGGREGKGNCGSKKKIHEVKIEPSGPVLRRRGQSTEGQEGGSQQSKDTPGLMARDAGGVLRIAFPAGDT